MSLRKVVPNVEDAGSDGTAYKNKVADTCMEAMAFFLIATGVAVVLVGASLVIAAWNIGAQLASSWLIFLFQAAIAAALLAFAAAVIGAIVKWLIDEISALNQKHEALLRELKKRTPWFISMTLLLSQVALVVAEQSFTDNFATIAVVVALSVLFFIANEYLARDRRDQQVIGLVVWVLALAALPLLVWADRGFSLPAVLAELAALPTKYKIFWGLGIPTLLLLPFSQLLRPRLSSVCDTSS